MYSRAARWSRRRVYLACRKFHLSAVTRYRDDAPASEDFDTQTTRRAPRVRPPTDDPSDVFKVEKHEISTLVPDILMPTDFVDLSRRIGCELQSPLAYPLVIRYGDHKHGRHVRFPSGTHGFLYLAHSRRMPYASELRFRITDSRLPDSFALGRDLLRPYGTTWNVPLLAMLKWPAYNYVVEVARNDGFFTGEFLDRYMALTGGLGAIFQNAPILHSFRQPFMYHFAARGPERAWTVGADSVHALSLSSIFDGDRLADNLRATGAMDQDGPVNVPKYGSGLFCFESVSRTLGRETRVAVRCLRIFKQPGFREADVVNLQEGHLLQVSGKTIIITEKWDIWPALKPLFEHMSVEKPTRS